MRRFFSQGIKFLLKKQESIFSAAVVIMATVLLSRVLGLIRDRILATHFTVDELGVYFAAFRLPNLLFELLVMGALSTAFIPVFTKLLIRKDSKEAFLLGSRVINLGTLVVGGLIIFLWLLTHPLSYILVPGFSEAERNLMVSFTRIMLVGQLLPLFIGNFVTGMLQSFQRFLLPAMAPVVYNLGIIFGVLFFSSAHGLYGAVYGVVIGAGLYLLIQIPLLYKLGFKYKRVFGWQDKNVREVIRLMLPRTLGMAAAQIDTTVDLILASLLGARSVTIFHFAQHLQQLPIGLFGMTFAQAALPTFSAETAKQDMKSFKNLFLASMHQILFFVLPASMMLSVLRTPIVRLVFGAAQFDWSATVLTGKTLSFFAISIFAQSLVQLFARAFYALHDTKTPVIIGVISILLNTVLSIWLVTFLHYPVWALALSTSIASLLNCLLLFVFLYQKVAGFRRHSLFIPPIKMAVATLATGIFLYVPLKLFDQLVFDTTRVFDLILLTALASVSGLSVYVFLAWFLDIKEVGSLFLILRKLKRAPRLFFSQSDELVHDERSPIP